jgi:glycosyltransferase involved in cell wall biosynthesis
MSKKCRILQIITRLDEGGSARVVREIAQRLDKNKYDVSLMCGKESLPFSNAVTVPELIRNINPYKDIIALWKIYRYIKKGNYDIVHTHSSKAGLLGRWAAWIARVSAIIHTPHGHVFYGYFGILKSRLIILLEKITAGITTQLIALSEGEKRESLEFGIGKDKKWNVIHSAVRNPDSRTRKLELKRRLNIHEDEIVVGTAARFEPVKGIKFFIEAIPEIVSQYKGAIKFMVVGDGSEKESLMSTVAGYNLNDSVIFTGWKENVPDMISVMDIFVQPSLNEGLGITIIQAQELGKAVVGTSVQGIPDLVRDGVTGILVPPGDSEALAYAILKIVKDKLLRENMGEAGKRLVGEVVDGYSLFSVELMIKKLNDLYSQYDRRDRYYGK